MPKAMDVSKVKDDFLERKQEALVIAERERLSARSKQIRELFFALISCKIY